MVNEMNREAALNDESLRRRMETSNRNIQQMQQEHQQLLQEMETLRRTAAELSLNNNNSTQQRPTVGNPTRPAPPEISATEAVSTESVSIQENTTNTAERANNTEAKECASSITSSASDAEDEDAAKYIREKIAEIAAMKTQFRRVQHMVNTTNLIEAHAARNDQTVQQPVDPSLPDGNAADVALPSPPVGPADVLLNVEQQSSTNTTQENVELLMSLLTMFDEFKNDLRDQATSLRAERDRLRTLKEDLLRRRNQS